MFMQVFGADIVLDQLRQVNEAENEPEIMTMKLKTIASEAVCINTETGKYEVVDDV